MNGHAELAGLIARYATHEGIQATALPRVTLFRADRPTEPIHGVYEPALCIVAQGAKRVIAGDSQLYYDPAKFLVVSVDSPVLGEVIEASPDKPYLCVRLDLDRAVLGQLMLEAGISAAADAPASASLQVSALTPELLDAATRLIRLLDRPGDIAVLAPLAEREILYRLLLGDQGARLKQIAVADGKLQQVNRAIGWIKKNFREPFSIEAVTGEARMSASALHAHFKAVTAMSPLQYQKQLRLQEARQLMLIQAVDAATASHSVGYESPSQFSREYARTFGLPPIRDIARMKAMPQPFLQTA